MNENKVVIVTAVGRGMGAAIARELATPIMVAQGGGRSPFANYLRQLGKNGKIF